jgi:hypothetical protein
MAFPNRRRIGRRTLSLTARSPDADKGRRKTHHKFSTPAGNKKIMKFVKPNAADPASPPADSVGMSVKRWTKTSAVFIRDMDAQTGSFLHS